MGFLDLPAELRNAIYEQLLINNGTIEIRHRHLFEVNHGYRRALTQVAKSFRSDCLTIYYANNTFLFRSIEDCVAWLKILGPDCCHLRKLCFSEGALEGAAWSLSRPNTAHHKVEVSARLFVQDGTRPTFSGLASDGEIDENMKTNVENRLKAIEEATKNFGKLDAEVSGHVHHCKHCASGACRACRRSTCCYKVQHSDSE
jgi:hypothetical protein